MTFGSRFNRTKETEGSEVGRPEIETREISIDKTGHKSLIITGKTNVYDRIQAALEETKIENIIRRATLGDPTALAAIEGQYLDISDAPKTLAEAQNLIIKVKQEFDKLPLEVRRKYDMSAEKYVADYGSENWQKIIGIWEEPKQNDTTVKMEVKEDDS